MLDCGFANLTLDLFMEKLEKDAYDRKIPLTGVFELTPRCNMDCTMCYVHLEPEEMPAIGRELTAKEWIRIAKEAKDMGMLRLTLTGGEVLCRTDFREIYEALSQMGFLIQIYTNGYALTEETVEWLKQRPPYALRFTLYGFSDETYEKVCRVPDGFTRTMAAIERVRRAGIPMYMVSTITKDNEKDLPQMFEFAREHAIPFTYTADLMPSVRGASRNVKEYQVERTLPSAEEIAFLRRPENRKRPHEKVTDLLGICENYRKGFWITWNGNLQLCGFLDTPHQSLLGQPFSDAWNLLLEDLESLPSPKECDTCKYEPYCQRCHGMLYAHTGCFNQAAKKCCDAAKIRYLVYGPEQNQK